MSIEETQQTIEPYLDALRSAGDFGQYFSPDVRWTTMETGEEVLGRDAVRDLILHFHQQLFDAHVELAGIVVGDGKVALEAVFVGTQQLEFAGIEPTGGTVRMPYTMMYDIADGQITRLRAYIPFSSLRDQLAAQVPVSI